MGKITVDDMIDFVNDWDEDKFELYGGIERLLSLIAKKERLNDIDLKNNNFGDYEFDLICWYLINHESSKKKTYDFIKKITINSDLEEKDGKFFLELKNSSDLSDLFCRNSSRDYAESILGEGDWEPFSDTTDNVYRDVIYELNPQNLRRFKEIVSEKLVGNTYYSFGSSLLNILCDESENCEDKNLTITQEMIDRIVDDEETMLFFLKNELVDDLNSELYSLRNNSYNGAYNEEVYEGVWRELSEIFGDQKGEWVSRPNPSKENSVIYTYKIDVTNIIDEYIYKFLESNRKYSSEQERLSYYGSFMGVLIKLMKDGDIDCLMYYPPDYPDYKKVDKQINDNFSSYF